MLQSMEEAYFLWMNNDWRRFRRTTSVVDDNSIFLLANFLSKCQNHLVQFVAIALGWKLSVQQFWRIDSRIWSRDSLAIDNPSIGTRLVRKPIPTTAQPLLFGICQPLERFLFFISSAFIDLFVFCMNVLLSLLVLIRFLAFTNLS